MPQPTFTAVRQALAAYITTNTGLRATADRFGSISPPMAVILPATGTFITYSDTMDGSCGITLRAVLLVSEASSTQGQDTLDPYLSVTGSQSIYAALQKDPTLGGVVSYAVIREATGYGVMNWAGMDYLAAHLIADIVI